MPDTPTTIRTFEPEDQREHTIFQLFARPIAFHRSLVTITGSINAALMLSQAIYWSQRTKNPDGWFYKTAEEWQEETGMTRYEQEGARKKLREFDWWQEELRKANGVPTLHYRINANRFSSFVQSGLGKTSKPPGLGKTSKPYGSGKTSKPLTETTTETTNDTTYRPATSGTVQDSSDEIALDTQPPLLTTMESFSPRETEDVSVHDQNEPNTITPISHSTQTKEGDDKPKNFVDEVHDWMVEIRDSSNKAAALRALYVRLYGDGDAPQYGYIGKVARDVGGAGYLASRLIELSVRPPTGDILAYILAEHKGKESRKTSYRTKTDPYGGEIDIDAWIAASEAQFDDYKKNGDGNA